VFGVKINRAVMPWKSRWKRKSVWVLQKLAENSNPPARKSAPHIRVLGKILYPRLAPWHREARAAVVLWTVMLGILTGITIAGFLVVRSRAGGPW
jgi:hypothetical protein